jgi:hypothetical protein
MFRLTTVAIIKEAFSTDARSLHNTTEWQCVNLIFTAVFNIQYQRSHKVKIMYDIKIQYVCIQYVKIQYVKRKL